MALLLRLWQTRPAEGRRREIGNARRTREGSTQRTPVPRRYRRYAAPFDVCRQMCSKVASESIRMHRAGDLDDLGAIFHAKDCTATSRADYTKRGSPS